VRRSLGEEVFAKLFREGRRNSASEAVAPSRRFVRSGLGVAR